MFKGLGNLANLGSMLKQAQQMGTRLQTLQEELKSKRVTGSAGGGMVEVEANGAGEILSIRISPELFGKGDREMVEDLLPGAVNQALQKGKQLHAEAMQQMTGGLELPGLQDALSGLSGDNEPE
jgi:DNA-binding YbaB/EbfC family protein